MWSNETDYFHYNLFPRLAQGVLHLEATLLGSSASAQTVQDDRDLYPSYM